MVESGRAKVFAPACARVQVDVLGRAAFLAADFAYQSGVLLLRIVALLFAPVAFLVPSHACSALDQALAI